MTPQPRVITGLLRFTLDAQSRDRVPFVRSVITPIKETIDRYKDADYDDLRIGFGPALYAAMNDGREARAERLMLRQMQSRLIGHIFTMERMFRHRDQVPEVVAHDARNKVNEDPDFIRRLIESLRQRTTFQGLTDTIFRPRPDLGALQKLLRKTVLTSQDFERLSSAMRANAFRVWQVNDLDIVQGLRDQIATAISNGQSFRSFVGEMGRTLEEAGQPKRPLWHANVLYQNNIASAYADAKNEILNTPTARALFPYRRYMTRQNSRVRPSHAALHGLVFPSDHAFWSKYDPPWDYNCRCYTETVTRREAERLTVQQDLPAVSEAKDFTRTAPGSIGSLDDDLRTMLEDERDARLEALR